MNILVTELLKGSSESDIRIDSQFLFTCKAHPEFGGCRSIIGTNILKLYRTHNYLPIFLWTEDQYPGCYHISKLNPSKIHGM